MPEADDPARTVFQPGPSGDGERPASEQGRRETTQPPPPHESMPPAESIAPERTVFQPQPESLPGSQETGPSPGEGAAMVSAPPLFEPPSVSEPGSWRPVSGPSEETQIPIGTVLNHIYRVDRLVARGGMGEVYEGTNVSDAEDRVAIKVVLQHLAGDPNVQALFRAEARTLTRLAHPGLVQYRLLALEPRLDVLYIVTEFVDGPALSEVLSTIEVPPDGLAQFIRRMASALAAAHALGKVHRDMSPDNILLPHALLDQAKIIDFGIAKDLEGAQGKTIVGSGFAGKLAYVAPEQFGESKDVGPWTDVYSLGLVALAVVLRGTPDMGATFAEAVERRQQVPDLSSVPPLLRPLLARMLQPDRLQRYQSMNEVVAAIDRIPRLQLQAPRDIPAENTTKRALSAGGVPERAQEKAPRNFAIWAATAAVVVIAAALVFGPEMFNAPEVMPEGAAVAPATHAAEPSVRSSAPPATPAVLGTPAQTYEKEVSGPPVVIDTADLTVAGHRVSLSGIDGVSGSPAALLEKILTVKLGNFVICERVGIGPAYNCFARTGGPYGASDISELVLLNGAARTNGAATARQRSLQEQAMAAHLGIWAKSPFPRTGKRHAVP